MTNEEAIERIDFKMVHCNNALNCDWECEKCSEAESMVKEALEKQIPKKPIGKAERPEEVGKIGHNNCPVCGYLVSGRYCSYCGQRIDWSKDND